MRSGFYVFFASCVVVLVGLSPAAAQNPELKALASAFEYPDAKPMTVGSSGTLYHSLVLTTDDLEAVVAFYKGKIDEELKGYCLHGTPDSKVSVLDDSFGPSSRDSGAAPSRPVEVKVLTEVAEAYYLTVVISRGAAEEETHIALIYALK